MSLSSYITNTSFKMAERTSGGGVQGNVGNTGIGGQTILSVGPLAGAQVTASVDSTPDGGFMGNNSLANVRLDLGVRSINSRSPGHPDLYVQL